MVKWCTGFLVVFAALHQFFTGQCTPGYSYHIFYSLYVIFLSVFVRYIEQAKIDISAVTSRVNQILVSLGKVSRCPVCHVHT